MAVKVPIGRGDGVQDSGRDQAKAVQINQKGLFYKVYLSPSGNRANRVLAG